MLRAAASRDGARMLRHTRKLQRAIVINHNIDGSASCGLLLLGKQWFVSKRFMSSRLELVGFAIVLCGGIR